MNPITLLGYAAATCTSLALIPQVVQIWRSRSARDVSLGTFVVMTTGVLLWLIYGLMIHDRPVTIANAVTLGLSGTILVMKLRD